jgi:hypothetical protein
MTGHAGSPLRDGRAGFVGGGGVVLSTFFLPGCTDTEVRDAGSGGAVEAPGLSGRIAVRLFDDEDNVYDYDVFTKGGIIRVTERADETALRAALFLNRAGPGQDILANPQGTYGLGIPSYYAIGPLVDLANGEEFPLPGDERYKWPFAWSPNGRYLAAAVDETNAIVSYTVAVIDIERRAVALVRRFEETYIVDVAWSPASDRLAVLVADEHTGLGPLELLSAAAGHPAFSSSSIAATRKRAASPPVTQR